MLHESIVLCFPTSGVNLNICVIDTLCFTDENGNVFYSKGEASPSIYADWVNGG